MALTIVHEDEHLFVVNKAAGQIVIPGRGRFRDRETTLARQVEHYLNAKAYVVHRLDRETSGIILFAKNAETHRDLNIQFERREIRKIYLALVQGIVAANDGTIREPIRQFGSGRMGVDPQGQSAMTGYRVIERLQDATLLEVIPKTGRRHQLRVHLYAIGHPVMGDALYGHKRPVGGAARLMLHAYQITFRHPSGNLATFQVEPGEDWFSVKSQFSRSAAPRSA